MKQPIDPKLLGRNDFGATPFDGDLLGRKALAQKLTHYVEKLQYGAVLAIDAHWGDGKTWFGNNWVKLLEQQGHKCVLIDAFAQDYVEDPFMLLAAEVSGLSGGDPEGSKDLRKKAAGVMKALLPVATKAMINFTGRLALGSSNLSEELKDVVEIVDASGAEIASQWVEKKLEEHTQEKASVRHFRDELSAFASRQDKPVVILIDELDRCRPTFAVQLIERMKHFFDVPNLVFVLLINRQQLEQAIKGVYGEGTDAENYLGKFVHQFFSLPKNHHQNSPSHKTYTMQLAQQCFQSVYSPSLHAFVESVAELTTPFMLSLREIEQTLLMYALIEPDESIPKDALAYMTILKTKYPSIFRKIERADLQGHHDAIELLDSLGMNLDKEDSIRGGSRIINVLYHMREAHKMHIDKVIDSSSNTHNYLNGMAMQAGLSSTNFMTDIARQIMHP